MIDFKQNKENTTSMETNNKIKLTLENYQQWQIRFLNRCNKYGLAGTSLKKGIEPEFEEPEEPPAAANKIVMAKWTADYVEYRDKVKKYKKDKCELRTEILSLENTLSMQSFNKITSDEGFEKANDEEDPNVIELWKILKKTHLIKDKNSRGALGRVFRLFKQTATESFGEYDARFRYLLENMIECDIEAKDEDKCDVFVQGIDESRYKEVVDLYYSLSEIKSFQELKTILKGRADIIDEKNRRRKTNVETPANGRTSYAQLSEEFMNTRFIKKA